MSFMKKKVIVSNGFSKYPLADAAFELNKYNTLKLTFCQPAHAIIFSKLFREKFINDYEKKQYYDAMATDMFFQEHGVEKDEYYLMTCHRRENVHIRKSFENILSLLENTDRKVFFTASYRTQKVLKKYFLSTKKLSLNKLKSMIHLQI